MTLEEMKRLAGLADKIEAMRQRLQARKAELALVNLHGRQSHHWDCRITLKEADRHVWGDQSVGYTVRIPFAVVQQQAVTAVVQAERELTLLEMQAPA